MIEIVKQVLVVFFTLLTPIAALSQTFEWLKTQSIDYDYNPSMVLYTTASDAEENAYFIGVGEFDGSQPVGFGDLFLKKYNADGNLIYEKTISGKASILGALCDNGDNIFFYGQQRTVLSLWGEAEIGYDGSSENYFLVKLNPDGVILWSKNLNYFFPNHDLYGDIKTNEQGEVLFSLGNWGDSYVIKMDEDGNLLDTITQTNVRNISSIDSDSNGNLYVTGSCSDQTSEFGGVHFPTSFSYSMYLVKYNSDGQPEWVNFVEDITCPFPKIAIDGNDNIYWSGELYFETLFGDIQAEGAAWVFDFFLVKANTDGVFEWLREVPQITTGDATIGQLDFIDIQESGNIVLGGKTRGFVEWEEGVFTGKELKEMDDKKLKDVLKGKRSIIFNRNCPEFFTYS